MNSRMQAMQMSMEEIAASLYDGGWRAADREELIYYDFTDAEADDICELLKEYEIADRANRE